MKKSCLIQAMIVFSFFEMSGQDLHFSQFFASPLTLNPATTAIMAEDYRIICNYASQWGGITTPFRTIAASYDMTVFNSKKRGDKVGAGLILLNDVAGDSKLSTTQTNLSITYIKGLSRRSNQFLSMGFQGGIAQRSMDFTGLEFDNQFDGTQYNANLYSGENGLNSGKIYFDFAVGLLWYYAPMKRHNIYVGSAVYHLNKPNQSFNGIENDYLPYRRVFHGGGQFKLGSKTDLLPTIMYMNQGIANEISGGGFLKYYAGNAGYGKAVAFYLGSWYRFGDAIILGSKIEYGEFSFGVSYDINVSDLSQATKLNGGPEASLTYTSNLSDRLKRRKVNKTRYCPKFN